MTFPLTLNGRPIAPACFDENTVADCSPYERHTVQFCRDWLAGRTAFVLKTSGSTGEPKIIDLTRQQMQASARLTGQALGLRTGDRALACLSTDYVAGLMMLVRGLELGLALTVVTPTRNPLAALPHDARFDFAAFVPLQLQEILTATPEKKPILNRMRAILVGGAPVGEPLLQQIRTLDAPVYHTYGMTETVSHIALRRLNGSAASDWFTPLDGIQLQTDARGCLVIAPCELTRQQTLMTNDCVELRSDGAFRWLGRIDNVINSGGFKVQAEKVEAALAQVFQQETYLARQRFLVGSLPHPEFGQIVAVIIEGLPSTLTTQAAIRIRLRDYLHDYEIPRRFCFQPHLLETPTGKIDRRATLAAVAASIGATAP